MIYMYIGAILANKSGDWVDLVRTLGDRILAETHVRTCIHIYPCIDVHV